MLHFCIGVPLERLGRRVVLKALLEKLPGLRLSGEPRNRDTFHFLGLERLVVNW